MPKVSTSGPSARSGSSSFAPSFSVPRKAASTPANLPPRTSSGTSGMSGTWRMRASELSSSGSVGSSSFQACSTSAERSQGNRNIPA